MPPPLPLSSERLERHGLFLIEDGQSIFLWVGRDAVPQLIIDVFGLPNYEVLRGGKVSCTLWPNIEHLLNVALDDTACVRERVLSTSQCSRSEDSGVASWTLLSTPIHREGGRRTSVALVGSQLFDPGSCGCPAKLSAIHFSVEGQGMITFSLRCK